MEKIKFNENIFKLMKELVSEVINLLSHHYQLLKQEFKENASKIVKAIVLLVLGILIAYAGLLLFGILLIQLLSMITPLWAAILIITALYLIIPVIMLLYAIHLFKNFDIEPKKSIQEIKKTGEEAKRWLRNLKK